MELSPLPPSVAGSVTGEDSSLEVEALAVVWSWLATSMRLHLGASPQVPHEWHHHGQEAAVASPPSVPLPVGGFLMVEAERHSDHDRNNHSLSSEYVLADRCFAFTSC